MVIIYNASNNAESILSATINSSVTSLTVADASSFPAVPFVITIENEILEVTNKVGNVLTVVRGHESTTPAGHLAGVSVENRLTAGMHAELVGGIGTNASNMATHAAEAALKHIKASGSNANGSYIQFDDGTMLCFCTILPTAGSTLDDGVYLSPAFEWTYPAVFVTSPRFFSSIEGMAVSGAYPLSVSRLATAVRNGTVLSGLFVSYSKANASAQAQVSLMAVGMWK